MNGHKVIRFNETNTDSLTIAAADSPISGATNFSLALVFATGTPGNFGPGFYYNTALITTEQSSPPFHDWALCLDDDQMGAGLGKASFFNCGSDITIYGGSVIVGQSARRHLRSLWNQPDTLCGWGGRDQTKLMSMAARYRATHGRRPNRFRTAMPSEIPYIPYNYFNGDMAEIQMYGRDLSPAQVAALNAGLTHRYAGGFGGTTVNLRRQRRQRSTWNNTNLAINSLAGARGSSVTLGTGTLTLGRDNSSNAFSGVISGSGGLVKAGTGIFTLTQTNIFRGPTLILNGTLALGPGGAVADTGGITLNSGAIFDVSGAGNFTLGGGQTLAGNGSVLGDVLAGAGSGIYPGGYGAIGTLTFNNNLTLATNATVNFDLATSGVSDLLVVGGNLTPNGNTLVIAATNALNPGVYPLIHYAGVLTGAFNPHPRLLRRRLRTSPSV